MNSVDATKDILITMDRDYQDPFCFHKQEIARLIMDGGACNCDLLAWSADTKPRILYEHLSTKYSPMID